MTPPPASTTSPLERLLSRIEDGILTLLFLTLLSLALVSMVLRWLKSGLPFIDPVLRYGVFWLGLIGGVAAIRQGRHVQIGALATFIPPHFKPMAIRALALISAILCGALAAAGYDFILGERQAGIEAFGGIPLWILQLFLPLGFGWMSLRFALQVLGVGLPPNDTTPEGQP